MAKGYNLFFFYVIFEKLKGLLKIRLEDILDILLELEMKEILKLKKIKDLIDRMRELKIKIL